jgi:hypothetical protein
MRLQLKGKKAPSGFSIAPMKQGMIPAEKLKIA